jgi:hypothetical protein
MRLSQDRAESVVKALIDEYAIAAGMNHITGAWPCNDIEGKKPEVV